ncbi:hypothetical protein [Massilia sp. Se16.2.3]|uniref:hypothetical protein n=1 Tax=Massilia sp. Se16.2.3 TaxID=2709303 RepID=UPI001E332D50|nr:hypothetical protein [Massilia sp. Se16.2.3]
MRRLSGCGAEAGSLKLAFDAVTLEDWIDRLRSNGAQTAWLAQTSSKVLDKEGAPCGDKLIDAWLRQLAASAAGVELTGYLVARDALVTMQPIEQSEALAVLAQLAALWRRNLDQPLPVACRTALVQLAAEEPPPADGRKGKPKKLSPRKTYEGQYKFPGEVQREPCLARLWPDFAALGAADPGGVVAREVYGPLLAWMRAHVEVESHTGTDATGTDA